MLSDAFRCFQILHVFSMLKISQNAQGSSPQSPHAYFPASCVLCIRSVKLRSWLSWGPAVDQLYQMPQMARHCGGLPREDWNLQSHWKYFKVFRTFSECSESARLVCGGEIHLRPALNHQASKECDWEEPSDSVSWCVEMPDRVILGPHCPICRSWVPLKCLEAVTDGYFALRSLIGSQGFKWLLAKAPLLSGFAGPFWQQHSWVVKQGWTAHIHSKKDYIGVTYVQ